MATVEQEIRSINAKLSLLIKREKPETWVSPFWIAMLTGWDGNRMRMARKQGIIKYRVRPTGGYQYLLESLPAQFITFKPTSDGKD